MRTPLRFAQYALTALVGLFMMVPVAMSILAGVTQNFFFGISSGLTLRWVGEVWRLYSGTIALSMLIAISCVVLTLAIGVPCAYVLAKRPGRIARAVEEVLTLPVAIPGLALALALIITWGGFRDFRTSWEFILVGHVLYTLPFMIRSVLSVLAASEMRDLEEGAASLGAGFWTRLVTVVLPNAKGGILAGALMVLTLSVGEFNLTWMLHTPETKTLPVGLADSYASMRLEIASAYTLVFFIMIVPLLVAMQAMSRARRPAVQIEEEPLPCATTPQPSN